MQGTLLIPVITQVLVLTVALLGAYQDSHFQVMKLRLRIAKMSDKQFRSKLSDPKIYILFFGFAKRNTLDTC